MVTLRQDLPRGRAHATISPWSKPDLKSENAALPQELPGVRQDGAIGREPVRPAIEREPRIVVAHLALRESRITSLLI